MAKSFIPACRHRKRPPRTVGEQSVCQLHSRPNRCSGTITVKIWRPKCSVDHIFPEPSLRPFNWGSTVFRLGSSYTRSDDFQADALSVYLLQLTPSDYLGVDECPVLIPSPG